jgi:hypothetical protein
MSSPLTLATVVPVETGARPSKPDVSTSRKPPMNVMAMNQKMYLAELRIDCSTGRDSWGRAGRGGGRAGNDNLQT